MSGLTGKKARIFNEGGLTHQFNDRELYMKGIDVSYFYEGYSEYKTIEL